MQAALQQLLLLSLSIRSGLPGTPGVAWSFRSLRVPCSAFERGVCIVFELMGIILVGGVSRGQSGAAVAGYGLSGRFLPGVT